MNYALAIFDLDGTLVDSFPWFLGVVNDVASDYGFRRIDDAEIESLRHAGPREILRRLEVPLWKLPAIARHMRALKRQPLHATPLFEGVPAILQALRAAGLSLALVSSDSEDNARRQLGDNVVLFSQFACGASLFGEAAKFRTVTRRCGVAAERTIAIGDEARDIEAARAAGIACGAATWGYAAAPALVALQPDKVFISVGDIAEQLTA
jgi:phosphoglycolate phosphatase